MSAWIKLEKSIDSDPRVLRMARKLERRFSLVENGVTQDSDSCNACALPGVTLVVGALSRLWTYADTHIRHDDVLELGPDEINLLVGVPGFVEMCPTDWLEPIDEESVKLPNYQEHNGVEAKRKALTQKRVETLRKRNRNAVALQECNALALPDQTRPRPRPKEEPPYGGVDESTRPPKKSDGIDRELEQQILAAYHELLPDLPQVRDWNDRRKRKLRDRIRERVKAGKPADRVSYWRDVFRKAARSDFLTGRAKDWRCPGLEWILESRNFTKLIEGAYDNTGGSDG